MTLIGEAFMIKNYNNKKTRYRRYLLFAAALICLIILINIGLIYAHEKNQGVRGDVMVKISRGPGDNLLLTPCAFAVDSSENVLICDSKAKKVVMVKAGDKSVNKCFSYEQTGIGDNFILNMAVSKSGYIYLADAESNLVHKFSYSGKYIGALGRDKNKIYVKKIKYIFTDNLSNLVVVDSLEHKISIFDEDMRMTKEILIPRSNKIFTYVCGTDDSNAVYISSLHDNIFDVMTAGNIDKPVYSKKCSSEEKDSKIAECRVIGFDKKNNAYAKACLIRTDGGVVHYLVKFDPLARQHKKIKIIPGIDNQDIKILKPFIVLSEDTILSYEIDEKDFRLLVYKF